MPMTIFQTDNGNLDCKLKSLSTISCVSTN